MNNPLGVSPSKGNQGTTRGKEKIYRPWLTLVLTLALHARADLDLEALYKKALTREPTFPYLSSFFRIKTTNQNLPLLPFYFIVFVAMTLISCFRVSMTCFQSSLGECIWGWKKIKACQDRVVGFEL